MSTAALSLGAKLHGGHFVIERVLGVGGFAITYLAQDALLQTRVAIKEFFPRDLVGRSANGTNVTAHTSIDGEIFAAGCEQFLSEARVLARVDHPNVARVRTFFQENGTAYLVMDYYQGATLAQLNAERTARFAPREAVELMSRVLDGLEAVHRQNILHRDIKPGNIYVRDDGNPVLLDFGAARHSSEHSGPAMLTPGFAPIEQYSSRNQGPWTDVYGAAATLYWMLTGEQPDPATDRVASDTLVPPNERASVDRALSDAIMRGLAVMARDRPQTIDEFRRLLTAAHEQRHASAPQPMAAAPRSTPQPGGLLSRLRGLLGGQKSTRQSHSTPVDVVPSVADHARCAYGHFYDPTKHRRCPECGIPGLDTRARSTSMTQCSRGHSYDSSVNRRCPSCPIPGLDVAITQPTSPAPPPLRPPPAPPKSQAAEPITIANWGRAPSGANHNRLALSPGTIVGRRYQLNEPIRRPGPFAITYDATDTEDGRSLLVKEYFPRDLVDRATDGLVTPHEDLEEYFIHGISSFLKEGRALARLGDQPNLVRVEKAFAEKGTAYLVMGRHPGVPLSSRIESTRGGLSVADATAIVLPILYALDLVHAHDILHRDLTPESILVDDSNSPVLIGFGAARQAAREHAANTAGLPVSHYSALEQFGSGRDQGTWTDVYSCAAVLYHLLTGQAPPLATERLGRDTVAERRFGRNIPSGVMDVLIAGLGLTKRDRPQRAIEFAQMLETAVRGEAGGREQIPDVRATSPGQIFISYADADRVLANKVCGALEARGWRCWIAPRDIPPSVPWSEAIMTGIARSDLVVLVHSENVATSQWVSKELHHAVTREVNVLPVRVDAARLTPEHDFLIGARQWLDASEPPIDMHLSRIAAAVTEQLKLGLREAKRTGQSPFIQ